MNIVHSFSFLAINSEYTPHGGRQLCEMMMMMNETSVAPSQGNVTQTAFESFHLSIASKVNPWYRLENSDLVSRAHDTCLLPAPNGNHDMMAQVDFCKYWSGSF